VESVFAYGSVGKADLELRGEPKVLVRVDNGSSGPATVERVEYTRLAP